MDKLPSFSIYNASAGSGKTFTLVKIYLSKILLSSRPDSFRSILAITFTNKAVGEMKKRIMETLMEFSTPDILLKPTPIFLAIKDETCLDEKEIHLRSKNALVYILHNYAAFDVETIDRFNHRLIRTFARDLKLSTNFDVELEIDTLLNEAVDRVIARAGKDSDLTNVLLDFTFEKIADDKSWDITFDLQKVAKLLANENDIAHIELLKGKNLKDFKALKTLIITRLNTTKTEIINTAEDFIKTLTDNGLSFDNLSGNHIENYFKKLLNGEFNIKFDAKWQQDFVSKPLYRANEVSEIKSLLDGLMPRLEALFNNSKNLIFNYQFLQTIRSGISSLSLLNTIFNEYRLLQQEKNILPISEFNSRIFKEIKEQPAPFIYERLGEKYKHYFIDEFQDTSRLQWQNLIPLIDNALSQQDDLEQSGSLLLVGDAKQSIYRWRGGFPEQFMDLCKDANPFMGSQKDTYKLETNYRSYKEIIHFNNSFFSHIVPAFELEDHRELYLMGNNQLTNTKDGGFVSLSFILTENKEEAMEMYPQKVLEIINSQLGKGFKKRDICILTRKKSQGVAIGKKLSEENITIISSESLLLMNSPAIQFCIDILKLTVNFNDISSRAEALYFLYSHLNPAEDKHQFISKLLHTTPLQFSNILKEYDIDFSFSNLVTIPLYEVCEAICDSFGLTHNSVAYVQYFLDVALDFSLQKHSDIPAFLDYWNTNCEKLSIETSDHLDAVRIMTIHKAKGLEFPVVIYPFAEDPIVDFRFDKIWFPLKEKDYNGFSEFLIPLSNKVADFEPEGKLIFNHKNSQAQLDTINVLYVALTRAAEQLFVISNLKNSKTEGTISNLIKSYLENRGLWEGSQEEYTFGNAERLSISKEETHENIQLTGLISSKKQEHNILIAARASLLWDTLQEKAIEKGNLIHLIMAAIRTHNDVDTALDKYISEGFITAIQAKDIKISIESIIDHEIIKPYFKDSASAENEKEIFTKEGNILRPDRLNFLSNNEIAIIDYKTGGVKEQHLQQINLYASALTGMGFRVHEKLLVYIDDNIEVVKA